MDVTFVCTEDERVRHECVDCILFSHAHANQETLCATRMSFLAESLVYGSLFTLDQGVTVWVYTSFPLVVLGLVFVCVFDTESVCILSAAVLLVVSPSAVLSAISSIQTF